MAGAGTDGGGRVVDVEDGPLLVQRRDDVAAGVVLLTLAQPEVRNAMTSALTAAWVATVDALAADPSVRVVVVTGQGSTFCSGGDLTWIEAGADSGTPASVRARMLPFYRSWLSVRRLEVPVLAALNGHAIGAGLCLALACDLRWAVPTARLAAPFTALGMHPGMAATFLLPEAVGVVRAREMLFTGRALRGDEAVAWGLLNGTAQAEELLPTVLAAAASVAAAGPLATRLTKATLADGAPRTVEDSLRVEALAQPVTMASADLLEGLRAQRERRAPVFADVADLP